MHSAKSITESSTLETIYRTSRQARLCDRARVHCRPGSQQPGLSSRGAVYSCIAGCPGVSMSGTCLVSEMRPHWPHFTRSRVRVATPTPQRRVPDSIAPHRTCSAAFSAILWWQSTVSRFRLAGLLLGCRSWDYATALISTLAPPFKSHSQGSRLGFGPDSDA